MITLTPEKNKKRQWKLTVENSKKDKISLDLDLIQVSLANRFDIVENFMKDIDIVVPKFTDWYYTIIKKYLDSNYNSEIIKNSIDDFIKFSKKYVKEKNIDYSQFVNRKKTSKTSILFEENDLEAIAITSTCLKIYSIFCYDSVLRVPENVNKFMFNKFISQCVETDTTDKIFQLIRSRNYRSSITDRFMWKLIKLRTLEDPESSVMSIFNFFMTNLLSMLNIDQNPIHFLIKIVDDNLRWMMMEVYKEKIIFDENYSGSDDIYGTSIHTDVFFVYCCNDLISKAAKLGLALLEVEFNITDDQFLDIKERLDKIKVIDPSMKLFTLPIISKIFKIPYEYLLSAPPKHLVLMAVLIYILGKNTFVNNYPVLSNFLLSCPQVSNTVIIKSSYQLRDAPKVMECDIPVFGLNSRKLKHDILSPICGILSSSKKNLINIIDGKEITKITYVDLEQDCIDFYTKLYSNGLNDIFKNIENKFDMTL